MSEPANDPLSGLLARMREAADVELGPNGAVIPSDAVLRETALDREILSLAQAGLTYVEIGRNLGLPIAVVVERITGMLKGLPLYSKEHLAAYLAHQLDLVEVGIKNALDDMADKSNTGDYDYDKLASTNRHNGRMALNKFMIHQAAIMGLLRQRIEIEERTKIEITVVRSEDFDAL